MPMTMTAVLLAVLLLVLQSACTPGAPMGEEARESFEVWLCPVHTDEFVENMGDGVTHIR
jgi:hypothetical protein